ncbi:MAG: hypothetical protein ACYC6M_16570, partial [Terriglobales bacterium]
MTRRLAVAAFVAALSLVAIGPAGAAVKWAPDGSPRGWSHQAVPCRTGHKKATFVFHGKRVGVDGWYSNPCSAG